uniref:Uncharacterized protein n=1 Tax=Palpitomonas bilix TaxID=652834 RepID=A0A7S3GLM1_9EUKA|mmetsp:Transcript_8451/g.22573  ORF Transcript_8451/g.22573 Transcript_8451/m.22573 type:complete len:717 (+) Transcript_8451:326-2476(+)
MGKNPFDDLESDYSGRHHQVLQLQVESAPAAIATTAANQTPYRTAHRDFSFFLRFFSLLLGVVCVLSGGPLYMRSFYSLTGFDQQYSPSNICSIVVPEQTSLLTIDVGFLLRFPATDSFSVDRLSLGLAAGYAFGSGNLNEKTNDSCFSLGFLYLDPAHPSVIDDDVSTDNGTDVLQRVQWQLSVDVETYEKCDKYFSPVRNGSTIYAPPISSLPVILNGGEYAMGAPVFSMVRFEEGAKPCVDRGCEGFYEQLKNESNVVDGLRYLDNSLRCYNNDSSDPIERMMYNGFVKLNKNFTGCGVSFEISSPIECAYSSFNFLNQAAQYWNDVYDKCQVFISYEAFYMPPLFFNFFQIWTWGSIVLLSALIGWVLVTAANAHRLRLRYISWYYYMNNDMALVRGRALKLKVFVMGTQYQKYHGTLFFKDRTGAVIMQAALNPSFDEEDVEGTGVQTVLYRGVFVPNKDYIGVKATVVWKGTFSSSSYEEPHTELEIRRKMPKTVKTRLNLIIMPFVALYYIFKKPKITLIKKGQYMKVALYIWFFHQTVYSMLAFWIYREVAPPGALPYCKVSQDYYQGVGSPICFALFLLGIVGATIFSLVPQPSAILEERKRRKMEAMASYKSILHRSLQDHKYLSVEDAARARMQAADTSKFWEPLCTDKGFVVSTPLRRQDTDADRLKRTYTPLLTKEQTQASPAFAALHKRHSSKILSSGNLLH